MLLLVVLVEEVTLKVMLVVEVLVVLGQAPQLYLVLLHLHVRSVVEVVEVVLVLLAVMEVILVLISQHQQLRPLEVVVVAV